MRPPAPDGRAVATAFGLGAPRGAATYAARGELGFVYRLQAGGAAWAVKVLLEPPDAAAAKANACFQEAVIAAGVPAPRPRRTPEGAVVRTVEAEDGGSVP